jgi:hypothetical protein
VPDHFTLPTIGRRPVLVAVLGITGLLGFAFGSWLGNLDVATASQPTPTPSTAPSPSVEPTARLEPTPSVEPTTSADIPSNQRVVLSIDGSDHDVSDPFEVRPGWQIVWQVGSGALAVMVTGDPGLGMAVDESGPASGAASMTEGGTFRLEIVADGPWEITVVDGEG